MAVAILILETLNCAGVINYKQSLDTYILNSGYKGHLLASKRDILRRHNANNQRDKSELKRWIKSILLIYTRIFGVFIFSYPMLIISVEVTSFHFKNVFQLHLLMWLVTAGSLTSAILTIFLSTKYVFSMASLMYLACLVTIMISVGNTLINEAAIAFVISFFSLGLSYHVSFSAVMETTNFKITELFLAIGYFLEMIPIGVLHYLFIVCPANVIATYSDLTVLYYGLAFCIVLVALMIIVQSCLPKTFGRSLIIIRNGLLDIQICNTEITIQENSIYTDTIFSEPVVPLPKRNLGMKLHSEAKTQISTKIVFERNSQLFIAIPRPFFDNQPNPVLNRRF